jgi:hypothetical protein
MTSTMTQDQGGTKKWYNQQGQLHRTDGPAYETANGGKEWYLNGQLHRTDGPAIEYPDGHKRWYLNGQRLTVARWIEQVAATEQERTLLMLKFG